MGEPLQLIGKSERKYKKTRVHSPAWGNLKRYITRTALEVQRVEKFIQRQKHPSLVRDEEKSVHVKQHQMLDRQMGATTLSLMTLSLITIIITSNRAECRYGEFGYAGAVK